MRRSSTTLRRAVWVLCTAAFCLALAPSALASDGSRPKHAFNIMMNYELGMHCTGFEFAYCCVLPPYNSILAQVVKTQQTEKGFATLLEADPVNGLDFLGRPTVVRDPSLDGSGEFKKYRLRYWHEAQPRNDGRGAPQTSTLISAVEGNSLLMWNTVFDAAAVDGNNALVLGEYNGAVNVVQGDGATTDANDNYANGWLNHLYIYEDLEGSNSKGTSAEIDKIRLGLPNAHIPFSTILPENSGPALHPMGPAGTNLDNVLTFSTDHGTVVFTQAKVLENLPVMLTSPRIWEALGLPLTPFEDTLDFFGDPGAVSEETVRPYVLMKAQLEEYPSGDPVLHEGQPVIGFGTAPIDIPNCERCHSLDEGVSVNSAQNDQPAWVKNNVREEAAFWNAYYGIDVGAGDSDWYSRIKAAAISILSIHDAQHGTSFTANYPGSGSGLPQNTRLGHESVFCQRCHADNVIAVVKSAECGPENADPSKASEPCTEGTLIKPLSEALHYNHKDNAFSDSLGRNGGCQGCHPAHRSDGNMEGYPIDERGLNTFADSDNRDAAGGCYVGRDVHSNPYKDEEATTPSHLNAVGEWLRQNVAMDTGQWKGIWCANCHNQLGQELWRAEDCSDLIHGDCITNPRAEPTLAAVAAAVGISEAQAIAWLDPKNNEDTATIWSPDVPDADVATIEVGPDGPVVTTDQDGDISVNILSFCTTEDCVAQINANKQTGEWLHKVNDFIDPINNQGVAVPFSAATDGRDHWLSPGEPHCADCHEAPYVEQSGNINAFPPFNYPRKASLFRYSRGHQDISCQGCHESTHGLYPVTPPGVYGEKAIDQTTWDQAASLNSDGSHGPLKCGACHEANDKGVPTRIDDLEYRGRRIKENFDLAVGWAHTFTLEHDSTQDFCLNCHDDESDEVGSRQDDWLEHAMKGRVPRKIMDRVEIALLGHVSGDPDHEDPLDTVCLGCHDDESDEVSCGDREWKEHLTEGRVAHDVWEYVSETLTGSTCGW